MISGLFERYWDDFPMSMSKTGYIPIVFGASVCPYSDTFSRHSPSGLPRKVLNNRHRAFLLLCVKDSYF